MGLEAELEAIRRCMDDDMGDEPLTPSELAQHKVAMAVRDAWLATAELVRLRCDPVAAPFVASAEGDLWSILNRAQLLVSEIRAEQDNAPKLKVVSNG